MGLLHKVVKVAYSYIYFLAYCTFKSIFHFFSHVAALAVAGVIESEPDFFKCGVES